MVIAVHCLVPWILRLFYESSLLINDDFTNSF